MAEFTPAELAERIAQLDQALREARELETEIREKMAVRARRDRQTESPRTRSSGTNSTERR